MYFKVNKSIIKKVLFIFLIVFLLYFSSSFLFSQNNHNLNKELTDFNFNLVNYNNQLLKIISKEEKRFSYGYKQGFDTSCGIAIIATFLKYFYFYDLNEKTLIDRFFIKLKEKKDLTISLDDIKHILGIYGFKVKGYKIGIDKLKKVSKENKYLPIIVHFKKPEKHFTLYIGNYYQYYFIVDPSIGVYFIDENEFKKRFSSYVLIAKSKKRTKNIDLIITIKNNLRNKIDSMVNLKVK